MSGGRTKSWFELCAQRTAELAEVKAAVRSTKSWFELCAQRNAELAEVKAAVGSGQDINAASENSLTGLMQAALNKNHAILEWLLGRPDTDITLTDRCQQNVFHLSCWVDNFVGLDRLLSHPDLKAGVNSKDLLGRTPLMCAGTVWKSCYFTQELIWTHEIVKAGAWRSLSCRYQGGGSISKTWIFQGKRRGKYALHAD